MKEELTFTPSSGCVFRDLEIACQIDKCDICKDIHEHIKIGLEQAARGELKSLGSFVDDGGQSCMFDSMEPGTVACVVCSCPKCSVR